MPGKETKLNILIKPKLPITKELKNWQITYESTVEEWMGNRNVFDLPRLLLKEFSLSEIDQIQKLDELRDYIMALINEGKKYGGDVKVVKVEYDLAIVEVSVQK